METTSDTTLTPPMTGAVYGRWPPPAPARSPVVDSSWIVCTLATVVAIWVSVALISVLSPDMVHGSEHQRMPVAAFGAWFWGFGTSVATVVALARLRGDAARRPAVLLAGSTMTIWVAAAVVSILGPTQVTGSDPTTIPTAALIAPIVATLATIGIATVVVVFHGPTVSRQHR